MRRRTQRLDTPTSRLPGRTWATAGRAPLYLKYNSYGEFVFDWGWAEAYRRQGLSHYPKLVGAIPYTPVTSPRLLLAPDQPDPRRRHGP